VTSIERPRRQAVPVMAALESRTLKYFAGSLALHLGIWTVLQMVPVEDGTAIIDLASGEDQNMHLVAVDHEDKTEVPVNDDGGDQSEAGASNKAKLAVGEAGDKKPGNDPQHIQLKDRGETPQLSRAAAIEEARRDGILGDMPALMSGVSSVAAEYDFTSGFDTTDRPGGVFDGTGGGGPGFGLGRTGFGGGGGCTHAPCGIGVGDYNLTGIGNRMGNGYGIGPGKGPGLRGYHPTAPEPRIGQANVIGEYDKAIIRRYIKRNIDKIAYCYEHELLAKPSLAGEITVQFFIQPNGSVRGATGAGFDGKVASCVADVVGTIEFPAPKDGGGIQVNYPFNFHPAGGQ
jgi:hypothetical protein